ncbi:hypothetical protein PybrP1_003075 [[Pythium] brassicae (nom. inval.)]|nr:hypothetical protein PybrP1_003075 [[Pythium] brassicae (nom. inval.)]
MDGLTCYLWRHKRFGTNRFGSNKVSTTKHDLSRTVKKTSKARSNNNNNNEQGRPPHEAAVAEHMQQGRGDAATDIQRARGMGVRTQARPRLCALSSRHHNRASCPPSNLRCSTPHQLTPGRLDTAVVGFLVHAKLSNVAVSSYEVIAVGMAVSRALAIAAAARPRYLALGGFATFLRATASAHAARARRVQAWTLRWRVCKPSVCAKSSAGTTAQTSTIWTRQRFLRELDQRMAAEGCNILVLVDNAPSHKQGELTLTHVTIAKLPPNTTALLQPMDQGVKTRLPEARKSSSCLCALGWAWSTVRRVALTERKVV